MALASLERNEALVDLKNIRWNAEKHTIVISNRVVALTYTEYQLLLPLRSGTPVTYSELALAVYNCQVDSKVRTMLDKHVDRIRRKLRGKGFYVYCILGYGYMLSPEYWVDGA